MDKDKLRLAMSIQSACNPRAVANTLTTWLVEEGITSGQEPPLHIRLVLGQLNYLLGQGLGPSWEDLNQAAQLEPDVF